MQLYKDDAYGIREEYKKKVHKFAQRAVGSLQRTKKNNKRTAVPAKSNESPRPADSSRPTTTMHNHLSLAKTNDVREATVQVQGKGTLLEQAGTLITVTPSTWLGSWRSLALVVMKRIMAESDERGKKAGDSPSSKAKL